MKWIGLTGGIATGKSTVTGLLRARGYAVVDSDQLARAAVRPGTKGYAQVVRAFGPGVVLESGELDRKTIGQLVFSDLAKLRLLENIVLPHVRDLAAAKRAELATSGVAFAFYDVPLLFEKKMQDEFDLVAVVACAPALQLKRMINRDGLSADEALHRLQAQLPIDEKTKLADVVIRNDSGPRELEAEVDAFLQRLNSGASPT